MKLFEAKDYDYSDYGRVKPIRYTEDFLKEIAENNDEVCIVSGHTGEKIGMVTDIGFVDGWLVGNVPSNVQETGKGLSPLFDSFLLDGGDVDVADGGELKHFALVDNPRSQLLFNEKGTGDKMSDNKDLNDVLASRVKELERELAVANNQLESNKKKMEEYNELVKEVKELRKANSEYESQLESNKNKATKWDEYVTNQKESLVDEIAGDDSTMKDKIKDWDIDKLNFLKEHKNISTDPKGVGNGDTTGTGELNEPPKPTDTEIKEQKTKDFLEFYEDEFGKKPSFLD